MWVWLVVVLDLPAVQAVVRAVFWTAITAAVILLPYLIGGLLGVQSF